MPPMKDCRYDLDEVHELNALFLAFLQARIRTGGDGLGLPRSAARLLETAPPELVEALASFPAALFRLELESARPPGVLDPAAAIAEPALLALQLGILQAARHLTKHRVYAARLYLRISGPALVQLARLTLAELTHLASTPGLVSCAYHECDWLWQGLLSETRPEARRELLLLGLQPQIGTAQAQA